MCYQARNTRVGHVTHPAGAKDIRWHLIHVILGCFTSYLLLLCRSTTQDRADAELTPSRLLTCGPERDSAAFVSSSRILTVSTLICEFSKQRQTTQLQGHHLSSNYRRTDRVQRMALKTPQSRWQIQTERMSGATAVTGWKYRQRDGGLTLKGPAREMLKDSHA